MQLRWQYWICIARRSSAPAPNSVRRPSLPDSELICESDSIRRKTPRLKGGAKSWLAINAVIRVEGIDGKLSAPIRKATAQPQKKPQAGEIRRIRLYGNRFPRKRPTLDFL